MPGWTVIGVVYGRTGELTVAGVVPGRVAVVDDNDGPPHARRWSGHVQAADPDAAEEIAADLVAREHADQVAVRDPVVPGIPDEVLPEFAARTGVVIAGRFDHGIGTTMAKTVAYWWYDGEARPQMAQLADGEPFRPGAVLMEVKAAMAAADERQLPELRELRRWVAARYRLLDPGDVVAEPTTEEGEGEDE